MADQLEALLREAAAKGLTHLSIHPTPSEDGKTVYWRATATPSTMHKYVSAAGTDIIEVTLQALRELPAAKRRPAPKSKAQLELTATVTGSEGAGPEPTTPPQPEGFSEWLPKT